MVFKCSNSVVFRCKSDVRVSEIYHQVYAILLAGTLGGGC